MGTGRSRDGRTGFDEAEHENTEKHEANSIPSELDCPGRPGGLPRPARVTGARVSYSPIQGPATRLLQDALRGLAVPAGPWDCLGRDLLLVCLESGQSKGWS